MRILSLALLVCFSATLMLGGSIPACTQQTLLAYENMTQPCAVGGLEFFGFGYIPKASNGANPVPAAAILVIPQNFPGDPTLEFSSGSWSTSGGGVMDSAITYSASTVSGADAIQGAHIGVTAATSQTGSRTVLGEQVCAGGNEAFCAQNPQDFYNLRVSQGVNPGAQIPTVVFLQPVSEISVLVDLSLVTSNGRVGVSAARSYAPTTPNSATPEPVTPLLSLSGILLLLGSARLRKIKKS